MCVAWCVLSFLLIAHYTHYQQCMTDTWISALTPLNMTRASNNTKGKRRKRSKQKVSANDFGVGGLQKIFSLPSSKVFILYRISF